MSFLPLQVFVFLNKKTKSLFHQRKRPGKIAWTAMYRRAHKKDLGSTVTRRKRRNVNKNVPRAIAGASLEVIKAKRNEKPEERQAAREKAIAGTFDEIEDDTHAPDDALTLLLIIVRFFSPCPELLRVGGSLFRLHRFPLTLCLLFSHPLKSSLQRSKPARRLERNKSEAKPVMFVSSVGGTVIAVTMLLGF